MGKVQRPANIATIESGFLNFSSIMILLRAVLSSFAKLSRLMYRLPRGNRNHPAGPPSSSNDLLKPQQWRSRHLPRSHSGSRNRGLNRLRVAVQNLDHARAQVVIARLPVDESNQALRRMPLCIQRIHIDRKAPLPCRCLLRMLLRKHGLIGVIRLQGIETLQMTGKVEDIE